MSPDFIRKHIRLKDFPYKTGYVYFITICTFDRQPHFINKELAGFIESVIDFYINNNTIAVYCYCIMPDHIHILLSLCDEYEKGLSSWVSSFKRYINAEAENRFRIKNIWQGNYHDHVVRTNESLNNIAEYILNNPVRKGIVSEWMEYPFSKIKL
ncbi:MAG: REP-associated tyrosine transposase [Ignavibacteria bacterium]